MSEEESDFSDADPDAILKSMQDIDDLDAELFGSKSKKSADAKPNNDNKTLEKKRVSFSNVISETEIPMKESQLETSEPKKQNAKPTDDFDFDLDDPLGDLLSPDEDDGKPSRKSSANVSQAKSAPMKKPASQNVAEDLFSDDDSAGFLLDNSPSNAKKINKKESIGPQMSIKSLMGDENNENNTSVAPMKKMASLDDFLQSPIHSASAPIPKKSDKVIGRGNTLDEDLSFGGYQPSLSNGSSGQGRRSRQRSLQNFSFDDPPATKSTTSSEQSTPEIKRKATTTSNEFISPVTTRTETRRPTARISSPIIPQQAPSPKPVQNAAESKRTQQTRSLPAFTSDGLDVDIFQDNKSTPEPSPQSRPMSQPVFVVDKPTPARRVNTVPVGQAVFSTPHSTFPLQSTYKSSDNALELAQESRIEVLNRALEDMRSRMVSEVESIKDSYETRFQMLRASMRDAVQVETNREVSNQEEIKRLRSLHVDALNDCRIDYDAQVKHLREAHQNEIEAIKNSSVHARTVDSMMTKLDDTTKHLQQLALKYESAYYAITQQTESLATGNQQAFNAMLKELQQQHKTTNEAQVQLQQNAARLEGIVSGLSKKLEEQHYQIQLAQNQLQITHTSLQNDRSQMLQQMNKERELNRKTQREIIDLQEKFQHSMNENLAQILRHSENLKQSFDKIEEDRSSQVKHATKREREIDEAYQRLSLERIELTRKQAEIESTTIKLNAEKESFEEKMVMLQNEKNSVGNMKAELQKREKEAVHQHQRAMQAGLESETAINEARQIQESHDAKIAVLHNERNEIAKQRRLLAEERRLLAKERSNYIEPLTNYSPSKPMNKTILSNAEHHVAPNKHETSAVLWKHTAVQDYGFLESEKVFVESLRQSPFRKTS